MFLVAGQLCGRFDQGDTILGREIIRIQPRGDDLWLFIAHEGLPIAFLACCHEAKTSFLAAQLISEALFLLAKVDISSPNGCRS